MSNSQDIFKAIGVHAMWKQRLAIVIKAGRSDIPVELVEADNNCDFGRWLYALSPADHNSHFKKVQALHAEFHKEAANVIRLAVNGDVLAAKKSMSPGGAYARVSMNLTRAMMEWKRALDSVTP